eukprot:COSAG01_NODE_6639_length_3567_cov_37.767013_2_plen_88_part_00
MGSRSFITFAAKVKISLQSRPTTTDTASGVFKQHSVRQSWPFACYVLELISQGDFDAECVANCQALPLLRVPKKHQLTTEGGGLDSQ